MNILFAHQYFPGQFDRLARHLLSTGDHQVKAFSITSKDGRDSPSIDGVEIIPFGGEVVTDRPPDHVLNGTEDFIRHAASLALAAEKLKQGGWYPDLIHVHTGWGVGAFLQDVFPRARFIKYCEWFYQNQGSDAGFLDQDRPIEARIMTSLLNLPILAELGRADRMIAPTAWQRSQFPPWLQPCIDIVPDGIDMEAFAPDGAACFTLKDGPILRAGDRIVTYVARGADPYRGFSQFIAALEALQQRDPKVEALIAGDRKVYYGAGAGTESHFHDVMRTARLDPARTHFLGRIDTQAYIKLLQVSAVHVYLTVPFVLSWSMLEAMATGCLVIGSDTQPVTEFITDQHNGRLCNFFDSVRLAELIKQALDSRQALSSLRAKARETIRQRWSLETAISRHMSVMQSALTDHQAD